MPVARPVHRRPFDECGGLQQRSGEMHLFDGHTEAMGALYDTESASELCKKALQHFDRDSPVAHALRRSVRHSLEAAAGGVGGPLDDKQWFLLAEAIFVVTMLLQHIDRLLEQAAYEMIEPKQPVPGEPFIHTSSPLDGAKCLRPVLTATSRAHDGAKKIHARSLAKLSVVPHRRRPGGSQRQHATQRCDAGRWSSFGNQV